MKNNKLSIMRHISIPIGFLSIVVCAFLNPVDRFACAILLLLASLFTYFYTVFRTADRNWMDIRALFSLVWLGTLSLASLRLNDYQKEWETLSWLLSAAGYLFFELGATLGIFYGKKIADRIKSAFSGFKLGKLTFRVNEDRYFYICISVAVVGLICFVINVLIKGFVPAFSNDIFAYINFYTKFHIFSVASTMVSGLCYYSIKRHNLSIWKKTILWLIIFYDIILFPILVVSRGVFVVTALTFTTVFFYLNRRRLLPLLFCLAVIASVYFFTSSLRSLTDDYLAVVFTPSKIEIGKQQDEKDPPETLTVETVTEEENSSDKQNTNDPPANDPSATTFQLSPKAAFLYGYLTVSHDNFNEAVLHSKTCTWGLRQLQPFNTILRLNFISELLEDAEYYIITPHLNTTNFFGVFYYDFHALGVVLCAFIWAIAFGMIQSFVFSLKGAFSLLTLGNAMAPIVLSFFSSWIDSFTQWMFWGTILIFFLLSSVHFEKENH